MEFLDTDIADLHHGRMSYVININRGGKATNYQDPQYYIDIAILPPYEQR